MRAWLPLLVLTAALPALSGCATMAARAAFSRGEKAKAKGDLDDAITSYEEAARKDPKKPEYQTAAETARKEAADSHVQAARQAEAAGDFAGAVKRWDDALRYLPGSEELKARKQLAVLKTKQSDPVEFFEAAKKLAAALPGDAGAAKALADAKQSAFAYHLRLADTFASAKAYERAHAEYEIARKIDPDHAAFKSATYRQSEARFLEALGDERMKTGDMLAAYQAYQKAAALESTPALERKVKRAEQGAGPVVEQLAQAAQFESLKQWEDAAEIYTVIAGRQGAPADVGAKAQRARKESAKLRAERAKAYADKGSVQKAVAELTMSLEHTDGPAEAMALLGQAVEAMNAGMIGDAKAKVDRARELGPDLPAAEVAPQILVAAAQAAYEAARAQADGNPADALIALRRLEPFADRLRGYSEAREKLVRKAFGALIDNAEKRSAEGRYESAAELLQTAMEISKAPKDMADYLRAGTAALVKKEWDLARDNFEKALAVSKKSNLARVGRKVAADARLADLRREAQDARAVEDALRAAAAYRAILAIDPNDPEAKAGAEELRASLVDGALRSAQSSEAAGKLGAAYLYYRRVLDLDPINPEAKAAVAALAQSLNVTAEPEGYVAPMIRGDHLGDACAGAEKDLRERTALYLNKTRKLGAEYVTHDVEAQIDEKKRPAPPVTLRSALEACSTDPKSGAMTITVQLLLAGQPLAQERVSVKFDPGGIPKDELADGLSPKRVEKQLVGEAAKAVTNAIRPHAPKLADWRAVSAKAALDANDPEAAARAFALLTSTKGELSEKERYALRDLERFLLNIYR